MVFIKICSLQATSHVSLYVIFETVMHYLYKYPHFVEVEMIKKWDVMCSDIYRVPTIYTQYW